MSIDTLTIARRLEAAKLPREQAEAIRDSEMASFALLATKADIGEIRAEIEALRRELTGEIEALRRELKGEIDALRKEVSGEIGTLRKEMSGEIGALRKETMGELKLLEQRMTIKLGTMLMAAVALMAALVKLL
jgi:polyhydroxyalkanoate synthesis regulator phasin